MGVAYGAIGRWERGERRPNATHRALLALLLDQTDQELGLVPCDPKPSRGYRGHGLRQLRLDRGLTAARLAARIGVPAHTIYNWERGGARIPAGLIASVADALSRTEEGLIQRLHDAPATVMNLNPRPVTPLARLRVAAGLSQTAAARKLSCSRSSLRAYERGSPPPLAVIRRMAIVFGVPTGRIAAVTRVGCPSGLFPEKWQPGELPLILRALRAWTGGTQAELAGRLGVSTAAVRSWEIGRHKPVARTTHQIEAEYALPPGSLLRGR